MLGIRFESRRAPTSSALALFGGVGAGALLTYFLDLSQGRRRRALLGDELIGTMKSGSRFLRKASRDAQNRVTGVVAEVSSALSPARVDDVKLAARVRSALGRVVSHPHALRVSTEAGRVTLEGDILASETGIAVARLSHVRGVREVENRLTPHARADGVPALHGAARRRRARPPLFQMHWAPSVRLVAGVAGALAAASALGRSRTARERLGLGTFGAVVLARAWLDVPFARMVGIGAKRRAIELHKTITVHASIEEVYALWADFEQFPRFMQHVMDVHVSDAGLSHWKVAGPAGLTVEWDAETTLMRPYDAIAWKSREGSAIGHAGIVRFEPVADGTRVDVRMVYNPVAGKLGHAVAALFHVDPKRALDEDLVRFKSLLEDGKATAKGQTVRLGDLPSATILS